MSVTGLLIGLGAAVAFIHREIVKSGDGVMTATDVRALADETVRLYGFNADPRMLVAMAFIESSFNPRAVRVEPHIEDASAGLMQTLSSTAQWLYDDFSGYRDKGRPSLDDLMRPDVSMYFGAAYVDWLSRHPRLSGSEERIVRAYNGGPGTGAQTSSQTANHYRKYLDARRRFG